MNLNFRQFIEASWDAAALAKTSFISPIMLTSAEKIAKQFMDKMLGSGQDWNITTKTLNNLGYTKNEQQELVRLGILAPNNDVYEFTEKGWMLINPVRRK